MKLLLLLLLLPLFAVVHFTVPQKQVEPSFSAGELQPIGETEYRVMIEENSMVSRRRRRRLAPYELCLTCKCCTVAATAAANRTCITMPCCFGIDCQLPDKPYGVCAFVPKTCSCTSCASSS